MYKKKQNEKDERLQGVKPGNVGDSCFLDRIIKKANYSKCNMKNRLAKAKKAFLKRQLLISSVYIENRKCILKAYVQRVYRCETWIVDKEEKQQIVAFECDVTEEWWKVDNRQWSPMKC